MKELRFSLQKEISFGKFLDGFRTVGHITKWHIRIVCTEHITLHVFNTEPPKNISNQIFSRNIPKPIMQRVPLIHRNKIWSHLPCKLTLQEKVNTSPCYMSSFTSSNPASKENWFLILTSYILIRVIWAYAILPWRHPERSPKYQPPLSIVAVF